MVEEVATKGKAHWYVIHTYSGQEARAKQGLLERVRSRGRESSIHQIVIPEENVVELVKGQRRTTKRKFLPGYILVQMEFDDELWHIVKNTARVTGFVGSGSRPSPIPESEVQRLIGKAESEKPRPAVIFEEGEEVRVVSGPFVNFSGTIAEVQPDRERLQVMVSVFGRSTPLWLNFEDVEKG
ncbi:MAG: transcription termination/antitermination protein NusG [Myxococcota bacterium]